MTGTPTRTRGRSILAAAMVVGLTLVGQVVPVSAATASVRIVDGGLSPSQLAVVPGTSVTWTNEEGDRHRMRSTSGPVEFDSGNMEPGESFTFRFEEVGTYQYLDDRNKDLSNYRGTIVVQATAPPPTATPAPGATPPPAPPTAAQVRMAGRAFTPRTLTVDAGSRVTFLNDDGRDHTASARDNSFDSGVMKSGATFVKVFSTPGTYAYLCLIHPDMTGAIAVRGAAGATPPPAPAPTPTPPPAAPPPGSSSIAIVDFDYTPATFTGPVGTRVSWINRGTALHTVTARDGSFDSGFMPAGGSYTRAFGTAGTYLYICSIHPNMQGTIRITSAGGSVPPPAPPAPTPKPKPVPAGRLIIADFAFRPATITVAPGTTLVWQNTGVAPHTVTSRAGLFDSRIIPSGGTYSHTFAKAGTYQYLCAIHPDMTATVLVPGAGGTLPPPQAPPPAPPPSVSGDIQIVDFGYSPATKQVPIGTTVRWVNVGVAPHSATARDGSFDSGFLETGDYFDRTFTAAATIEYICSIHPQMSATLIVTDAAGAAPSALPVPSPSGAGATPPPGSASIDMADFEFQPGTLSITAGTSVLFRNIGAALHTATAADGSWDTEFLEAGGSVSLVFETPGTYPYTCVIHPAMVGTLEVIASAGGAGGPAPTAVAPGPVAPTEASIVPTPRDWDLTDWTRVAFGLVFVAGACLLFMRLLAGSARPAE